MHVFSAVVSLLKLSLNFSAHHHFSAIERIARNLTFDGRSRDSSNRLHDSRSSTK